MDVDTSLEVVRDYDAEFAIREGPHRWFFRTDDLEVIYESD